MWNENHEEQDVLLICLFVRRKGAWCGAKIYREDDRTEGTVAGNRTLEISLNGSQPY